MPFYTRIRGSATTEADNDNDDDAPLPPAHAMEQSDSSPLSSSSSSSCMIPASSSTTQKTRDSCLLAAFWSMGLFNNASYVLMLASAKTISEGGVALVFLCNIVPSLAIKASAPYWFHRVGYTKRIMACTVLMGGAFVLVACSRKRIVWELLGVTLASAQCGLGEASLLALAGKWDAQLFALSSDATFTTTRSTSTRCITCFSSGTGLAGVFGFLWKFVWNDWLGVGLSQTLSLATTWAVLYGAVYRCCLWQPRDDDDNSVEPFVGKKSFKETNNPLSDRGEEARYQTVRNSNVDEDDELPLSLPPSQRDEVILPPPTKPVQDMSRYERFRLVLSLYPYMIPLFLVYAAEYSLQAGTWTAIGFPVDSIRARDDFYEYSNWVYQIGVFLSRSSGTLWTTPLSVLWLMPLLQCVNVVLFWWVAAKRVWYNYTLLIPCFYVGLLGGAVYVNGYTRICADLPLEHREFALSSTSLAEGLGVLVADVAGLFLQSCLYQLNGIEGAVVSCPIESFGRGK